MKIIVDDKIPYIRETLDRLGAEVEYIRGADIKPKDVADADALIVRTRTRCNRDLLEGSKVKFVATATIGIDHLDTEWLDSAGIHWVNCPGCNASSVGQYVETSLMRLSLTSGLTVGIVGCGHVGSEVKKVCERMGLNVIINDPFVADPSYVSLNDIILNADVITFHVPLTYKGEHPTHMMADSSFFSLLATRKRPLECIFNTSRGGIINEQALLDALDKGVIRHAVIDTWENEPDINRRLMERADIATPHIAGYSADGKVKADNMVISALCSYFGIENPGEVVPPSLPPSFIYKGSALDLYDPLVDTTRLRSDPDSFEEQRGNYPLRRERA
ncbi:MAG: 4-phosphoerythronate dehydrogenase [Prevotella sp.]